LPNVSPPNPCSEIASPYLIFSAVFSPRSLCASAAGRLASFADGSVEM
jgi:hypothetical protein